MTARLSAADRRRPTPWDLLVAVLVAAGLICSLILYLPVGPELLL